MKYLWFCSACAILLHTCLLQANIISSILKSVLSFPSQKFQTSPSQSLLSSLRTKNQFFFFFKYRDYFKQNTVQSRLGLLGGPGEGQSGPQTKKKWYLGATGHQECLFRSCEMLGIKFRALNMLAMSFSICTLSMPSSFALGVSELSSSDQRR